MPQPANPLTAPVPLQPQHSRGNSLIGWDAPNEEIKAKLVGSYHKATTLPVVSANVLVAAAVVVALWDLKSHGLLLGWLAAITLVALCVGANLRLFAKEESRRDPQYWAFRFIAGGLANGLAWGMGAFLLFDPAAPVGNILMVGVICGMAAGNVVASFAVPGVVYCFLAPAILLSMVMPLARGGLADQTLALLWLLYLVIMVVLTRSAHKALARSIKLSHDNALLAGSLVAAKERAEKLGQAKSDFLAVMSHEIRTPMHGMLGFAELLAGTPLNKKQEKYLARLREAGEHLANLLNNILDFSKIDAEKLELDETVFFLPDLVDSVLDLLAVQARIKGIELSSQLSSEVSRYWRGDPYRLKQVLINIVGNAVKFTDHGGVKVGVETERPENGKSRLRFIVADSGPGISHDRLGNIFDPFVQADPTVTRRHGGTGLGLAISKRLAEAMGGQIGVESQVGQGSVFSFSVPLALAEQADLPGTGETASKDAVTLRPLRILLADDSPLNRLVMKEYLGEMPCTIDEAENGREAVEMCRHKEYDVVLMDMRMPGMDGIEATRRIRKWESDNELEASRVIALTASAFDSDREAALAAGSSTFIAKPVRRATLINALRKTLKIEPAPVETIEARPEAEEPLQNLLPAFFSQVRQDLPLLQAAVAHGDPAEVSEQTHRLRGACTLFGFNGIDDLASALGAAMRAGEISRANELLSELVALINQLEQDLVGGSTETTSPA